MASVSDDAGSGNPDSGGGFGSNSVTDMSPIPVAVPVTHGEKPKKFSGTDFKGWQQKILFYLNILNLARFLHETTQLWKKMSRIGRWLRLSMLGSMQIFCAIIIYSTDWIVHCTTYIVRSRQRRNYENS